ncbi:hypothetical protein HK097_009367 [Rhizophlyctis rosea]|uniref:Uncharacterized protein n=1 Tax=Rhizophlyctis rosea TaxID=64517 RepID=A0AAD5SBT0_9FUNG|nr:hypothetical protein HK097_009367 [Rhizophlyctis rosea]
MEVDEPETLHTRPIASRVRTRRPPRPSITSPIELDSDIDERETPESVAADYESDGETDESAEDHSDFEECGVSTADSASGTEDPIQKTSGNGKKKEATAEDGATRKKELTYDEVLDILKLDEEEFEKCMEKEKPTKKQLEDIERTLEATKYLDGTKGVELGNTGRKDGWEFVEQLWEQVDRVKLQQWRNEYRLPFRNGKKRPTVPELQRMAKEFCKVVTVWVVTGVDKQTLIGEGKKPGEAQ